MEKDEEYMTQTSNNESDPEDNIGKNEQSLATTTIEINRSEKDESELDDKKMIMLNSWRVNMGYDKPDLERQHNIFDTGGIYIHAILATCYFKLGFMKSWFAAIATLLLTIFQILTLEMIFHDTTTELATREEEDLCGILRFRQIMVILVTTVVFGCLVYDDVKESIVEEAIINNAIAKPTIEITSLRAVEVIRFSLRIRRYILPWRLAQTGIYLIFQEENISTSDIILNFLAIGFIADIDNFLAKCFFSVKASKAAEAIVEHIISHYDDEENTYLALSSSSWPQTFAILPSMIITVTAIVIIDNNDCIENLFLFYRVFSSALLPSVIMAIHSILNGVIDKRIPTVFGRYIRCIGELLLNLAAFSLYFVVILSDNVDTFREDAMKADFSIAVLLFFVFTFMRSYYRQHVHKRDKTSKIVLFSIIGLITIIFAYATTFLISYMAYIDIKSN